VSDLFCAARLVLAPTTGSPARALAASLGGRRVASVYGGDEPAVTEDAGFLADELGVRLTTSADLRAAGTGESESELVGRHRRQLEEIADLHRGETVLVLADAAALGLVVPALVGKAPGAVGTVELENDADGWVLV
jgi:probable phosphoglycerate mutase